MNPNPVLGTPETKGMRDDIQKLVDYINQGHKNRELSIVTTKLEEAKMWLGKHLGTLPGNVDLNAERDAKEKEPTQ